MKKYKQNIMTIIIVIIFSVGLIPILHLSSYVHATGDDYGYGTLTHIAWLDTHSVWQTLKAAVQTSVNYWYGWQGTWFTIFVMALQPEVFSPLAYWIVPIVMVGINVASTSFLTYYLLVKRIGMCRSCWLSLDLLLLMGMLQFFPSTKSGIFWWNGAAHYIVPWTLAMLAVYGFFQFIDTYRKRYWLLSLVCMFCLGGSSYLAALLAPIILVFLLFLYGRKKKGVFWLLIPLAVELIGLVISFLSPGNATRGGESFGFGIGKIVGTIFACFGQGFLTIGTYLREKPFLFLLFLAAAVITWEAWHYRKFDFSFPYPAVFVGLMFCTWCAMFAPGIYAGVEVSGGVPNTILQVFVLTVMADIVYGLGWLFRKREEAGKNARLRSFRKWAYPAFLLCMAGCLFFWKGTLKETTFFNCVSFIASGRADDYKMQMEERLAILLDESQKEVELPAMNADQGPFMHMEVLKDPDGWTNTVVKQFYRKDKVVEVDREE